MKAWGADRGFAASGMAKDAARTTFGGCPALPDGYAARFAPES
jgi:hypothetical protein